MPDIDAVIEAVRTSPKYRTIAPDFVARIAHEELAKRGKYREAVKAAKNRLHQVAGAYLAQLPRYEAWLAQLHAADPADRPVLCLDFMNAHASTRERLSIITDFYQVALADIPPARSVLDIACGLNPLAVPFMPLADNAAYYACDIYTDLADFLNAALPLLGVTGTAWAADVTTTVPGVRVDLALVVKAIPCLQQIDRGIGARLLSGINADHILVSYPAQSLGGRSKGMRDTYDAQFTEITAGQGWSVRRFDFPTELAFLVSKITA